MNPKRTKTDNQLRAKPHERDSQRDCDVIQVLHLLGERDGWKVFVERCAVVEIAATAAEQAARRAARR